MIENQPTDEAKIEPIERIDAEAPGTMNRGALVETLTKIIGAERTDRLFRILKVPAAVAAEPGPRASRAVVAQALNMLLFEDLLARVPAARLYVDRCLEHGGTILHDHGAVRTVAMEGMGRLPSGHEAIARVLRPLGYELNEVYPLERLRMTGRSFVQQDFPEEIAQFFLSELHTDRFSDQFRGAVRAVTAESVDPLDSDPSNPLASEAHHLLRDLSHGELKVEGAARLLPTLVRCFARQHPDPMLEDYEMLLLESPEMAWIATEGNSFNHVTDRVEDVDALAAEQKKLGQPMKEVVETSKSGRVRQTAFHAARVQRSFRTVTGELVQREVPGSFLEFITRLPSPETHGLDLSFDSSNAQAIFKMTAEQKA